MLPPTQKEKSPMWSMNSVLRVPATASRRQPGPSGSRRLDREVPQASQYIHQAAEHIDTVADGVRTKNAREVAHDVQNFARQQPAIFFGGALLLGFAAVRIFKASPLMSNWQSERVGQ